MLARADGRGHTHTMRGQPVPPGGGQVATDKGARVHAHHENTHHTLSATLSHTSDTVTTGTHIELPIEIADTKPMHSPPRHTGFPHSIAPRALCVRKLRWENGWWCDGGVYPQFNLLSARGAATGLRDYVTAVGGDYGSRAYRLLSCGSARGVPI